MLNPSQIIDRIRQRLDIPLLATLPEDPHPRIHVDAAHWRPLAQLLRQDPELQFDWLADLAGVDYVADAKFCVVYDLWSFALKHRFAVKVFCPRTAPAIPSVADLWPAANWHEREAFDLFGIQFPGHPNLRRILLAEDWEGHPLRKDYVFPRQYHGIPGTVEPEWQPKQSKP